MSSDVPYLNDKKGKKSPTNDLDFKMLYFIILSKNKYILKKKDGKIMLDSCLEYLQPSQRGGCEVALRVFWTSCLF